MLGVDWGAFDLGVFGAGCGLYLWQPKLGICEDGKSIPCSRPDNAWWGDGLVGATGAVCRHAVCGRSVCVSTMQAVWGFSGGDECLREEGGRDRERASEIS